MYMSCIAAISASTGKEPFPVDSTTVVSPSSRKFHSKLCSAANPQRRTTLTRRQTLFLPLHTNRHHRPIHYGEHKKYMKCKWEPTGIPLEPLCLPIFSVVLACGSYACLQFSTVESRHPYACLYNDRYVRDHGILHK